MTTDPFLYGVAIKRARELTADEARLEPLDPADFDEVVEGIYEDLTSDSANERPQT